MKCEWVKENILLYVYDEVADDTRTNWSNTYALHELRG